MKRIFLIVPEKEIDDYTRTSGCWIIKGDEFQFIKNYPTTGDGECYDVIVQRIRDKKYFKFTWSYDGGEYYYDNIWVEVLPKVNRTVEWGWPYYEE